MVDSCLHCKFRNGAWRPRAAFQDRVLSFEDRIIYINCIVCLPLRKTAPTGSTVVRRELTFSVCPAVSMNFGCVQPGLHFERKSTAYTQTILRSWGTFSRPPMPIYAVGIAQVPSVNTPTIRRLLRVDAGLSLANSPQPMRIRKHLRDI